MDRRLLVMLDLKGTLAGVVAHELKDAIQPGTGESFLVRIVTDITARPAAVPFVSALIHVDNVRSSARFTRHEFESYPLPVEGYVRHSLANP